jgi:hypothetical protein
MITERTREAREWATFFLSLLTLVGFPCGYLVLQNQRLETRDEMRRGYVSIDVYHNDLARRDAEIARRDADNAVISAKIDRLTISVARLTDAVKLKDPP